MHELGLTERILDVVLDHARRAGALRVAAVSLVVGDLSSAVDTSLRFYWETLARGTAAEGARLAVRRVPARFACRDCDADFSADGRSYRCPACGGARVRISAGTELYVEDITVIETEEAQPCRAPSPSSNPS